MQGRLILFLAIGGLVLSGCSKKTRTKKLSPPNEKSSTQSAGKTEPPPSSTAKAPSNERKVITVESVDGFIAAIGPNCVIRLLPGQYNLTKVRQQRLKHVFWQEEFDGDNLIIRNVCNLRIEGVGDKPVSVIVNPGYVYVLGFQDADGVELVNLELGHAPQKGGCSGGVVMVERGKNVTIQKCVLFGCGMEGLTLKDTEGLTFTQSTIRGCTYGIMTVEGCNDLTFKNATFTNNKEYHGFVISDSNNVKFENCLIKGNTSPILFNVTSSSNVEIINGRIINNCYASLERRPKSVQIEDTNISNNKTLVVEYE
ncbi:MAG: right-handed parallel beta-helix repeat-containing protein [Phycisphaerae bacterium]|nr:right-handed parallel beta-helix repeat-containing protein [Phycisphaerae bacterium]